jgi:hypothetical protein
MRSLFSETLGKPKEKVCSIVVKKKILAYARLPHRQMCIPGGTSNNGSLE